MFFVTPILLHRIQWNLCSGMEEPYLFGLNMCIVFFDHSCRILLYAQRALHVEEEPL